MEDESLINLWKAYDEKLEKSLKLNLYMLDSIQKQKARSKLNALVTFKTVAVILGILWCAFWGLLLYGNKLQNIYFTVSVGLILVFTIIAVVVYIKHIILIRNLDYSSSITNTQKKLAELQASTINIVRILMLQMPFYCTWFWTPDLVEHDLLFQLISFPVTLLFLLLAIWLYKNITLKNMDKKWLKMFMDMGPEYKFVTRARDFLNELEEFKKEA